MKYEINSKELESCVVELFGTNFEQIQKDDDMTFLTSGGQIIGSQCRLFTTRYDSKLISSDSEIFTGSIYIDESIRFEISNIIKDHHEVHYRNIFHDSETDKYKINRSHSSIVIWTICLYLSRYKFTGEVSSFVKSILEEYISIFNSKHPPLYEIVDPSYFLKITKCCRINRSQEQIDSKQIGIMACNPLSSSQRRIILDFIQFNNISPEGISIDDFSDEQCVRRQLRLQYF